MPPVREYLNQIETALAQGDATEHTHRPALKSLVEVLGDAVTATNEPKRVRCGAPDCQLIYVSGKLEGGDGSEWLEEQTQ